MSEIGKERGVCFVLSISHAGLLALLAGFNDHLLSELKQEDGRANEAERDNEAAKTVLEDLVDGLLTLKSQSNLSDEAVDELLGGSESGWEFSGPRIAFAKGKLPE